MDSVDILHAGVVVALKLGAPMLILKLLVVILVLLAGGGWMLETLQDFTRYLFTLM